MITIQHVQESLSLAYVQALAGRAGLNLASRAVFDYGIDGTFYPVKIVGNQRIESGFPVRFQMKASVNWFHEGDAVVYDLEARAYNLIVNQEPGSVPCILILLCLPRDQKKWATVTERVMNLRHCCYWHRFCGAPTLNTSTQRIWIPRTNLLTPDKLTRMMNSIREEAMG